MRQTKGRTGGAGRWGPFRSESRDCSAPASGGAVQPRLLRARGRNEGWEAGGGGWGAGLSAAQRPGLAPRYDPPTWPARGRHSHWRPEAGGGEAGGPPSASTSTPSTRPLTRGTPAPRGISAGVGPPALVPWPPQPRPLCALPAPPPSGTPSCSCSAHSEPWIEFGVRPGSAPPMWEGLTEEPGISHELHGRPLSSPLPPRPAPAGSAALRHRPRGSALG